MKNHISTIPQIASHRVIAGCMGLTALNDAQADTFVKAVIEEGVTFFDHADIYGGGECETIFGNVLKNNPSMREKIIIQSKCGIVRGIMYDSSYEHIVVSAEESMKRLRVDYLDSLLIHRPDALVDPQAVAKAFDKLHAEGKVKHFGVSNHAPSQIELLKKYVDLPISFNQLQFSITNSNMINVGTNVNMTTDAGINRDGGVLDYSRLNDITIQCWSPMQHGFFEGTFLGNPKFAELNKCLDRKAEKFSTTPASVAAAWILHHPANMQLISGSTKIHHFQDMANARKIKLSNVDWYELHKSAGNVLP